MQNAQEEKRKGRKKTYRGAAMYGGEYLRAVRLRRRCARAYGGGAVRGGVRRCGALYVGMQEEEREEEGVNAEGETVAPSLLTAATIPVTDGD